jgi:hypothetical protein
MSGMRFYIFIAVWGQKYISHMCNVGLHTILAPNNLPALPNLSHSRFVFFVPAADEPLLRERPMVRRLAEFIRVEFKHIEPQDYPDAHSAMSAAHREAVIEAIADKAHAVVLSPDLIMSDGTLASIARYAEAGKKAVMVSGLRLAEETAVPALTEILQDKTQAADIVKPRSMMKFAMRHFHPEVERYMYDSPYFTPHPLVCLWSLGERGLLQRAFHLHPLLIDTTRIHLNALKTLAYDTIDGAFVRRAFAHLSDIVVEQDSDRILVFSFSSKDDHNDAMLPNTASIPLLQRTAYRFNVNSLHRYFFTQAIMLHTDDIDEDWRRLEEETAHIALDASDIKIIEVGDRKVLIEDIQDASGFPIFAVLGFFIRAQRFVRLQCDRARLAWFLVRTGRFKEAGHKTVRRAWIWCKRIVSLINLK